MASSVIVLRQLAIVVVVAILALPTLNAFLPSKNVAFSSRVLRSKSSSSLSMSAALIVQNKGGGHGELGFQLAKTLSSHPKITSITILQDDACKDDKEPFKSYATDIPTVQIIKAPLSDESMTAESLQSLLGSDSTFEYIWDNASKGPVGSGKALCDMAKSWGPDTVKLFTYVSSAGMYQPNDDTTFPMSESETPIKESSGQAQFDQYAIDCGLPLVSFRPQYIYGPKSNKYDYIDWYFDRIVRGLPLPIPGDGTQLVSLTNSEDVASLLACVLDKEENAIEQRFFNCGTDMLLSYNEVATLCAKAAGIDTMTIEHYDGNEFGKAKFPFRLTNFYVSPDMAKEKLSWSGPKHELVNDLSWYYEGYVQRGGPTKSMDLGKDWDIVAGSESLNKDELESIYEKWDASVKN